MHAVLLIIGLLTGNADFHDHTWSVNDHVVGHALSEDSTIVTTDGQIIVWAES